MPDFEPIFRELEIDMAPNEEKKRELRAFHRGIDYARKEILVIFTVLVVIGCLIFIFA